MKSKFLPYEPDQPHLFPQSPQDWLPPGHLAYFISETVDQLDLSRFARDYESDERGEKAYHPALMLKLLLYGYSNGVFSSRQIARRVTEDVAFRYLAAGLFPNHRTIRRFRQRHLDLFKELFVQVVEIAREANLVKLGVLAIDGTKVKANASKHKALSYKRLLEQEQRLDGEIKELLQRAKAIDDAEDREYGEKQRGDEIPEELKRREDRLKKIREAKARVEERQRERDRAKGREDDDDHNVSGGRSPDGRFQCQRAFGVPEDKAQDNFTDPESRIMKTAGGSFEQCYNGQAAVDSAAQIIVAASVTQNGSDVLELLPMVEQVEVNTGVLPSTVLADAGYRSEENLLGLEAKQVRALIALGRESKLAPEINSDLKATQRLKQRLRSKRGSKLYRRRKAIVEPIFGILKSVLGFRSFLLRGLENVSGEWQLVCCALNMKRMNRLMEWV